MTNEIIFSNANSRDTYFTVHNVAAAHKLTKGRGVKVGIIDWLFSYNDNQNLYSGYADITEQPNTLFESAGHGLMMATTLREIAPECEIYAINGVYYSEKGDENRIDYFEKSIDWAIQNKIDILTYSHAAFFGDECTRANFAIEKAVSFGIITTFIHNDSEHNIWPYGCMGFGNDQKFDRKPDINIYHFDYNSLFLPIYERYVQKISSGEKITSGNDLPNFSFSLMAVVLGGFVALLKSIDNTLTTTECKDLLIKTSYAITKQSENWYDLNPCNNVVDIGKALRLLCDRF